MPVLLKLHFQTGTVVGSTQITLSELEAHSSTDLPLWLQFESGFLTVYGTTSVPPAQVSASVRAYPNPFNPNTTIEWLAPKAGSALLTVFDARGLKIWTQEIAHAEAGPNSTHWSALDDRGRSVSSGTYLLEVRGATWHARTRLTLVR